MNLAIFPRSPDHFSYVTRPLPAAPGHRRSSPPCGMHAPHLLVLRGVCPPPPSSLGSYLPGRRGGFPGDRATRHGRWDPPAQSVHLSPDSTDVPTRKAEKRRKKGPKEEMKRKYMDESFTSPLRSPCPQASMSNPWREQGDRPWGHRLAAPPPDLAG